MRARDAAWDGGWAGVQDGADEHGAGVFRPRPVLFMSILRTTTYVERVASLILRNRFIEYCFCESAVLKSKVADTDFDKNVNLLPRYRALRMRRLDRARVHHHLGRCF